MWSFHVAVLQRTEKKCTKSYNARAQPLFCSLNLLFSDVSVAVAVVAFLNSLLISSETMKPENKSTGLGPTFCRDGPSKHRRLRHRKEIAHQTQRPETGLAIFLRLGSSDMSIKRGGYTKFGKKSRQIDIADTDSDLSSGVLHPRRPRGS